MRDPHTRAGMGLFETHLGHSFTRPCSLPAKAINVSTFNVQPGSHHHDSHPQHRHVFKVPWSDKKCIKTKRRVIVLFISNFRRFLQIIVERKLLNKRHGISKIDMDFGVGFVSDRYREGKVSVVHSFSGLLTWFYSVCRIYDEGRLLCMRDIITTVRKWQQPQSNCSLCLTERHKDSVAR